MIGRVKWFNTPKGYGFLIDVDSGSEVFVHYTALCRRFPGWRYLWKGEYVEYALREDEQESGGRSSAKSVRGIRDGPLMCETQDGSMPLDYNWAVTGCPTCPDAGDASLSGYAS